jgi:hypothetical protein
LTYLDQIDNFPKTTVLNALITDNNDLNHVKNSAYICDSEQLGEFGHQPVEGQPED